MTRGRERLKLPPFIGSGWVRLLIFMFVECVCRVRVPGCTLRAQALHSYTSHGHYVIGGVMAVSSMPQLSGSQFSAFPSRFRCLRVTGSYYSNVLALEFAVNEINEKEDLLPNVTLGFQIFDSCSQAKNAVEGALRILSGEETLVPNYNCHERSPLVGIVGDLESSTTIPVAQILGIYRIAQVSYGATDPILSSKSSFPSFFRTVPPETSQFLAINELLKKFRWDWVGILTSDDEENLLRSQELKREIGRHGGCVEFTEVIGGFSRIDLAGWRRSADTVGKASATAIVVYSSVLHLNYLIAAAALRRISGKVFILPAKWDIFSNWSEGTTIAPFNGSLVFVHRAGHMRNFSEFIRNVDPFRRPDDIFVGAFWEGTFLCLYSNPGARNDLKFHTVKTGSACTGRENAETGKYDISNHRTAYQVYNAVYAVAHSLHAYLSRSKGGRFKAPAHELQKQIYKFMRKLSFTNGFGGSCSFSDGGEIETQYDILNVRILPNETLAGKPVGSFRYTPFQTLELNISVADIIWNTGTQIPRSGCSETCAPGSRKAPLNGKPHCCYDCISCSEGMFSNQTDMENCVPCPDEKWTNWNRDECVPKPIEFLSYQDVAGQILSSVSLLLSLLAVLILLLFIKHNSTPIVKVNNETLSYVLLVSLALCFLCALLFIGKPNRASCILRQTSFGIIFSVAVSSVLAKTSMVVVAFKATKPRGLWNRCVGPKFPNLIVVFSSCIQVTICVAWICSSPPFNESNTSSEVGKILLECNEGSLVAFYSVLGYLGLQAAMSFVMAFVARTLPDNFNEAKNIAFSMVVFCSVWVSFIPAYLSTRGKNMVAVEVFAILASGFALLGFIFFPKCYIILLKPSKNTRKEIMSKLNRAGKAQ